MKKRIINNINCNNIIKLDPNNSILHPLSLNNVISKKYDNICLTKYNYDNINNEFTIVNNDKSYDCVYDSSNYKKYLYIPPVGITSEVLLKIYNIESIDSLDEWINDNIDDYNIITINRILNSWIINNINILKKHNLYLSTIYNKIIYKYNDNNILHKLNNYIIDLDVDTPYFINNWINKYTNKFNSNLLEDYIIYLKQKYN